MTRPRSMSMCFVTMCFAAGPLVVGGGAAGLGAGCQGGAGTPADPEAPPPSVYANDTGPTGTFRANPAFHPLSGPALPRRGAGVGQARRALRAEGEVIVLDGSDPRFVTRGVDGSLGITDDNQVVIVQEVLASYPDVFDTIQIYLSFLDAAHAGSAYYQGIKNEVAGIGRMSFDGRSGWGLPPEGRLSGFSNMNVVDQFGPLGDVGRPLSSYHAVVAQELTHRWLFFFTFEDAGGTSSALLGRDEAHWSRLAQANGSVQDGNRWREINGTTFLMEGNDDGFAPLDLYGMGIYGPGQVPPFYYLVEANLDGAPLTSTSRIPAGARVTARKVDVTIDQVVAALGPRNPPVGTETPYYRAAFVFIEGPDQTAEEIQPFLAATQAVQASFPETYKTWTGGAGAICTQTSARCPEPLLDVDGFTIEDGGDDLIAPGEQVQLGLRMRNDGLGTAEGVQVTVRALDARATVGSATVTAPAIPEGGAVELGMRFALTAAPGVECGGTVRVEVQATTREGPRFRRVLELTVGNTTLKSDALDEAPDWTVDPDDDDTATTGTWALDVPELGSLLGIVTQPGADQSPGASKLAFVTGPVRGLSSTTFDVDGGRTTLESPIFAVESARDPTLVFYHWFVGEDFSVQGGPVPVAGAALTVLGSSDGGGTWVELAAITERTAQWTRTALRLRDRLPITDRMRFRFVVADPSVSGVVEAGVDDLSIVDVLEGCAVLVDPTPKPPPEAASGCATSAAPSLVPLLVLGLAAAIARGRRRRS